MLVAVANAALLAVVPLAFGAALGRAGWLLLVLLSLAAAVEWRLARPEAGRVPSLVVASALALLCGFWIALAGPGGGPLATICGTMLLVLGAALRAAALATLGAAFVSAHRTGPLTTHGIYRHIRHPSETGQLLLGLGAAVLMASGPAALWWALVVLPLTLRRLRDEEAGLAAAVDYAGYRARVPALLPFVGKGLMGRTNAPRACSIPASSSPASARGRSGA